MSNTMTKNKMIDFVIINDYLTTESIALIIGTNRFTLETWLYGSVKKSHVEPLVEEFLERDGKLLSEIKIALRSAKKDRVALHQQRAAILQKARIHVPSKRRVPSLNNSTI